MGLEIGKSSVYRIIEELGFSYITGRKRHYKSDQKAQDDFKKTEGISIYSSKTSILL